MAFVDKLMQFLNRHLSSRITQFIFDPTFLAGSAVLAIIFVVLLVLVL